MKLSKKMLVVNALVALGIFSMGTALSYVGTKSEKEIGELFKSFQSLKQHEVNKIQQNELIAGMCRMGPYA